MNQDRIELALIPAVPELAGAERSSLFDLDSEDPARATVSGPAFDRGTAGLTSDTEIRSFPATQRGEVLAAISPAEKVRLATRLLQGRISDADIDAFEILYRIGDVDAHKGLRAAVANANVTSVPRRTRLQRIVSS